MFKKITFKIMLILALLVTTAGARDYSMTYHEIQIVDELGRNVTDITNLYIYAPGTTTDAVIYMDRGRQNVITIPMTEASLNTTLLDGYCYWWGPDGYDFSMTNTAGVGPEGNTGHLPRTGSDGTIVFPSFLHAISTVNYLDGDSITMGTDLDWVINGGTVDDTISFVPASDNADFIVGSVNPLESASMFVYISATEGWFIDSSVPSASWTGGTLNCNVSSNYATNINTGTSTGIINIGSGAGTGAINIGNDAGGIITLDTTESIVINADTTISVTNTTAVDQTYTTAGSFNFVATENAAETFYAHINGGAASSIFLFNQTGTEASAEGEVDASLQLKSLVGGIGLYSGLNDVDAIRLEATGGAASIVTVVNVDGTTQNAIELLAHVGGVRIVSAAVPDALYGLEVSSAIAGNTASQGSAIYAHTTLTGNIDAPTYNLGSWLDITGGTPTAAVLAAIDCGIYESGATLAGVTHVIGLQIQMMMDDTSNPGILSMMRFNTDLAGNLPDYFFEAANDAAIVYAANASYTDGDKVGAIKIYSAESGVLYLWVYDHPGQ